MSEGARREQATAWLAPLPPKPVVKEVAVNVSPGSGIRGVRVIKSTFKLPASFVSRGWERCGRDLTYHGNCSLGHLRQNKMFRERVCFEIRSLLSFFTPLVLVPSVNFLVS